MNEQATPIDPAADIVATGGSYYRRMRYLVAGILVLAGGWFAYDGWIAWPEMNRKYSEISQQIDEKTREIEAGGIAKDAIGPLESAKENLIRQRKDLSFHDDLAIRLQKVLTFGLPLLGGALVAWALYNSRGEIRLTRDTLTAPSHPPVHLDQIIALDQRLWDKKDIAYVEYDVPPLRRKIRLDAFVYETDPIVQIHDRIAALLKEDAEAPHASPADEQSPPN